MGQVNKNYIVISAIINWIIIALLMTLVSGFNPLGLIGQLGLIGWFVVSEKNRWVWITAAANITLDIWGVFFGGFIEITAASAAPQIDWVVGLYYMTLVGQTIYLFRPKDLGDSDSNLESDALLWRALFEQANDAILIMNLNHEIVDVNHSAVKLLGYEKDELINRSRRDLVPKDEWEETVLRMADILSGEFIPLYERRYIRKDGEIIWVEASTSLVVNKRQKPVYIQTVMHDVTRRKMLQDQLDKLLEEMELQAKTDSLTGLWNRRAITEYAESERSRSIRENKPFSLLMVDLDNFKFINDKYGHLMGDDALKAASKTMQWWKRSYDWVGRWGGDEFLVVLPETSEEDAFMVAKRLHEKIHEIAMVHEGEKFNLQVSIGVSSSGAMDGENDNKTFKQLIDQADQALYRSKQLGGNQVINFENDEPGR